MEKKNGKTMKGLPISERPYEKVLEKGPVSLSDAELLSVILRSGTKNIPVRDMAEEILNAGNPPGLAGLLHGTVEDYKEIRGVAQDAFTVPLETVMSLNRIFFVFRSRSFKFSCSKWRISSI